MIGRKLVMGCALLIGLSACAKTSVDKFRPRLELVEFSIQGSLEHAALLANKRGEEAIDAMREVLQKSDNVQVKIAMIQGLGHTNKDFDSVPLFLDIMEKDDKSEKLRVKANEAVVACGVPEMVYKPVYGKDDCQIKVGRMRIEYEQMKKLKVEPMKNVPPMPNGRLVVWYARMPEHYEFSIPLAANGGRIRLSKNHPQTANSYHLEVEAGPTGGNWDWKDLIIRVDILEDGSLKITAVDGNPLIPSYDLHDSHGRLLVYNFGPKGNDTTYTFPK